MLWWSNDFKEGHRAIFTRPQWVPHTQHLYELFIKWFAIINNLCLFPLYAMVKFAWDQNRPCVHRWDSQGRMLVEVKLRATFSYIESLHDYSSFYLKIRQRNFSTILSSLSDSKVSANVNFPLFSFLPSISGTSDTSEVVLHFHYRAPFPSWSTQAFTWSDVIKGMFHPHKRKTEIDREWKKKKRKRHTFYAVIFSDIFWEILLSFISDSFFFIKQMSRTFLFLIFYINNCQIF